MIRSRDLNKELSALKTKATETPDKVNNADVVFAIVLLAKLVRDCRTNQVNALVKQFGKEVLVEDKNKDDVEKNPSKDV